MQLTIDPATLSSAVRYAARVHADQSRKRAAGDSRPLIPYISHLLAVAAIVIEDGFDTEQAVAGLLHDVLEDQNKDGTRADEIERLFGPGVLELVEACTGPKADEQGMADFRTRKQVYLTHLLSERRAQAIRVSLADKVHNARSTVNDLEADGPIVWHRFNAPATDQLWWYGELAAAYAAHADAGRADYARAGELGRLVTRMSELSV